MLQNVMHGTCAINIKLLFALPLCQEQLQSVLKFFSVDISPHLVRDKVDRSANLTTHIRSVRRL